MSPQSLDELRLAAASVRAFLGAVLPVGAEVDARPIAGAWGEDGAELFADERVAVASAVLKRRDEFAAGRAAARACLANLGLEPLPIPVASSRAPTWPTGVVGSLSHIGGLCVAVVARASQVASVGVDLAEASSVRQELFRMVLTPEEVDQASSRAEEGLVRHATLVFSAKESFYKCQYPLTQRFVGFHGVSTRWRDDGSFSVVPAADLASVLSFAGAALGRSAELGPVVATACWLPVLAPLPGSR